MKRALLSGLSTLLLPFSAQAAATSAGGYLMRGGYQPRSYMKMDQQAGSDVSALSRDGARASKPRLPASHGAAAGSLTVRQTAAVTELVVIDSAVPDKAVFYRGVRPGVAIVEIDASKDGLVQLEQALAPYRDLVALHIVSHAEDGALQLGNSRVDAQRLKREVDTFAALRGALADGADLLLYGCDLASTGHGEELLDILREGSGADVAASANKTGATALGGDWDLEVKRGDITADLAFSPHSLRDFSAVLATQSYDSTDFCPGSGNVSQNFCGGGSFVSTDGQLRVSASTPYVYATSEHAMNVSPSGDASLMPAYGYGNSGHLDFQATGSLASFVLTSVGKSSGTYACSNATLVGTRKSDGMEVSTPIAWGAGTSTFTAGALAGVELTKLRVRVDNCPGDAQLGLMVKSLVIETVDPLPVVTDGRISISGASGTAGAYKIGDTVTATWNNTVGGDNSAGITGVTMDFSQFGGGAAVTASNTANTWTATYTIVSGAIDATSRNVSVTATNASGSTTTADTTNATVDNILPTVTDGRISISGGTGTSGAYKIGDTVTATWNNTAGGDNNSDTISSVTVNFTQFGGGAAVSASNSSGTWTATYAIVAGAIDLTNRNVTVTATDNAGNATSTSDTTNATVDNIAPSVSSITPAGGAVSSDTTVDFTVDFSESVSNVSTDDFTLVGTGSATGTIASVSASSGDPITVTVGAITGTGTLKVNLNGSTNIVDDAGNSIAAYSGGTTHTVSIFTAPDAPTIGAATAGDGQVSVAFTAPASNGGSAITGYTVTSNPGGITGGGNGFTTSPITVSGLTNGQAYTFTVTATNSIGTSTASGASGSATPMADQTITFANPGAQNFGATPTLSATSTSSLAVTFSSSTTGVCTITSGGALTLVTAGTCTIDADQGGNASTNAAPTVSRTFTVNAVVPGAPTIGTATAGDTQADVSFAVPSSNGGATITGYTVTANPGGSTGTGAGSPITVAGLTNGVSYTFTVTATNVAGTGGASAPSNSVTPASPQVITFANPGAQSFGTAPDLSVLGGGASSTSGLTITFTSSTTGVCTITSGGILTFVTAGTCTINANQAGNAQYLPATQVSRSFTVSPVVPDAPTIGTAVAGDTQAAVAFVAPSSNGGTTITGYTVTVFPADVAPVNGAASPIVVTGLTNGQAYTFTVTADNSAGTGPASSASNSVTPKATQTITFNNPGTRDFGTTPTFTATSDSGLSPTFTSSTTGVCTITSVGVVTFVATGTCTINADQAGNGSYLAATQVTRSFTVNAVLPGAPTIGAAVLASASEVDVAFTAPASNGGAAITGYTVTASPGGVTATGSGSPIRIGGLDPGTSYTFTVRAENSVGLGDPSAASSVVVTAVAQVITFTNPGAQDFGTTPTLSATADSGLTVSFASTTASVCTITPAGALTFTGVGACTITADQIGDASHLPAPQVSQTFTVNAIAPGAPTISAATIASPTSAQVSFAAPGFSGGEPVTGYTVTASPGGATATGSGSPITITGLASGTTYTFTVTAQSAGGVSAPSAASNAVTPMANQSIAFANPGAQDFGSTPTLSATSDSGLPVSFASSTPSVCTVTPTGALTLVAVGNCTITADQGGDTSHLPAAQVSQTFSVDAVAPAAPVIGSAVMASPTSVTVAFTAPVFTGGVPVTGYTVTANPGGATATGTGSPITITGLASGTAYTFTVTAQGSAGSSAPSASSNAVTPIPTLEVSAVNASLPYGAPATALTLSITGTATSVAVGTAPSHGTATVSGTTITYQPAPGYAGPDSFTYTASDAYQTTAPATVTITVTAPTVVLDAANPANGTGGSTYVHAFAASGGAAPYTFQLTGGTLPDGLALGTDGRITGTPTEAGSFTLTVQVTDASTGLGPFTTQRQYTLQVAAPQIVFALPALPPATHAGAFNQTLTVSGGTAPYTYAVTAGTLPQGVSLSAAGVLSGTPTQAGTFAFTIEVRDANGFTGAQAYELVVAQAAQAITGFSANPSAPVFAPNGTFELVATGGASGNPVVFASTTAQVCQVSGTTVTMLAAGLCSLTADQAGDADHQAAAQVRLDVDIAAAVPTLVWPETLRKVYGEPAFELTNPQSPSSGAFTFTSSNPDVASISDRTVTLHAEGETVITATQAAAGSYAGASVQMRLQVEVRPDPTRDPDVVGVLQAQVDASVRFANAQQSNIRDRLRQVRQGANASSNTMTLSYAGGEDRQGLSVPVGSATEGALPALPKGWGAWAAGTATFGSGGRIGGYDFRTDGLTLGADRAIGENLLFGVAGSLGRNDSDLNGTTSRLKADQRSLALYGLWRAGEHVFVDGMVATGRLDFDIRRWSEDAGATGTAARDGEQWFGSLGFGYAHHNEKMALTGYGRFDASRTTLDAYREYGLDIYDLAYRRQVVENSTFALGIEGSYQPGGANGRYRPFWTLEYRQALEDKGEARMNYVIWPHPTDYRLGMNSYNDNALSLAAGLDVKLRQGWLLSLLFGHEQASNSTQGSSIGLRLSYGQPSGGGAPSADSGLSDDQARCRGRRCANPSQAAPR
ncbi:fibronectin type III domain-containing protein [Pseudoxanthomonas sp. PXM02]|uniref:fibronectin type III domain-containing protein n=1 Tax=Pseudoxanthomonas sp. PXM02 TaxID=2769294 RepID=UPI00177E67C7|nr:fibronectin type III domain-containing protein [Pseudoxanthomonas sp. PXM02]MBD9477644.1 fibronectin type III domain-containing protein [Pseudoxanthomonas sp. PXM02]